MQSSVQGSDLSAVYSKTISLEVVKVCLEKDKVMNGAEAQKTRNIVVIE